MSDNDSVLFLRVTISPYRFIIRYEVTNKVMSANVYNGTSWLGYKTIASW